MKENCGKIFNSAGYLGLILTSLLGLIDPGTVVVVAVAVVAAVVWNTR